MKIFLIILMWLVTLCSFAQDKFWVYLKDKDTTGFDPYVFFDQKALIRRGGVQSFTDFPVNAAYVRQISKEVFSVGCQSRWLNAVAVTAKKSQIEELKRLPFVSRIEPMQYLNAGTTVFSTSDTLDMIDQFIFEKQLSMLQGDLFIQHGIRGKGIRIAIFDGGFSGLPDNQELKHLIEQHRIIKTFDFQHRKDFVYAYATHGTAVLSCIAGIYRNQQMGLAPDAEFLLARTEIRPEKHVEEEYWLAAMEWAEQNGADIISSSVGYTSKLYPVEAMDGHTSIVAKAANIAASKGMLVINSMGNDGDKKWEVLCTPADADSVLSVGGVNPFSGYHFSFSSFGPTSNMKLKPNVSAPGVVLSSYKNKVVRTYGTSFSAPLIAGFAACVWQLNRRLNNMQIFHLIEQSAHLYPYYDYAHGYGIPQASFFFEKKDSITKNLFDIVAEEDSVKVIIRKVEKDHYNPYDYLYYHIEDANGVLKKYAVVRVQQPEALSLYTGSLKKNEKIVFYYKKDIKTFTNK